MGPGRDINNTSSRLTVHFPTQCKQRTPSSPNLEPLGHKRPSPLQSVVSVVQAHCLGVLVHTKELSLQIPSPPPKPPLWTDWINTWQRLNGLLKHTQYSIKLGLDLKLKPLCYFYLWERNFFLYFFIRVLFGFVGLHSLRPQFILRLSFQPTNQPSHHSFPV